MVLIECPKTIFSQDDFGVVLRLMASIMDPIEELSSLEPLGGMPFPHLLF